MHTVCDGPQQELEPVAGGRLIGLGESFGPKEKRFQVT